MPLEGLLQGADSWIQVNLTDDGRDRRDGATQSQNSHTGTLQPFDKLAGDAIAVTKMGTMDEQGCYLRIMFQVCRADVVGESVLDLLRLGPGKTKAEAQARFRGFPPAVDLPDQSRPCPDRPRRRTGTGGSA